MRRIFFFLLFTFSTSLLLQAQPFLPTAKQKTEIETLVAKYSKAREDRDTFQLKQILTEEVDQLVSTGEWRRGLNAAVQGMLRSSAETPGTRVLTVETIRMFQSNTAIADCRYTVQTADGTVRKMWSTFVVVFENNTWKIAAIRNMLPTQQ